jgi:hypothetical protein
MSGLIVTDAHIDAVYDACARMRLASQMLSDHDGNLGTKNGGDLSWVLGSTKIRLEPIINLLEALQSEQKEAGA